MTLRTIAAALLPALLLMTPHPAAMQQTGAPFTEQLQTFIGRLEQIVQAGDATAFLALVHESADQAKAREFVELELSDHPARAVVRERDRRQLPGTSSDRGYRLTVDAFLESGDRGRVATWQLDVIDSGGRWRIAVIHRLTSVGSIFRLSVNRTRQFDAKDFTIRAQDVEITLEEGSVFTIDAAARVTGLVLLGRGTMRFRPGPETERQQVRIFAGTETLDARFESAFVRLGRTAGHVNLDQLVSRAVDPKTLKRAEDVFRAESYKAYVLDLGDLSREMWSLLPSPGDLLAEVETRRFGTLTYVQSDSVLEDVSLFDRAKVKTIASYSSPRALEAHGRFYDDDAQKEFEVADYRIDATYTPERRWLDGRAQLRVRIRSPLSQLRLRLAETLVVRSVTSDQDGRLFTLRARGQETVLVSLPSTLLPDSELTLTILYGGRVNPQASDRESLQVDASGRSSNAAPALEPSFLYSNRTLWYPQPGISGYSTATLRITVPEPFACVASGVLSSDSPRIAEREGLRWRTYEFAAARPLRYLSFVVARLLPSTRLAIAFDDEADNTTRRGPVVAGAVFGALDLSVNAIARYERQGESHAAQAADVIQFYRSLIGDTPYASFAMTIVEGNLPGGHSPGYFATISVPPPNIPRTWRNDPAAFDAYPEFVLAHEIAHQWWGQAVGWRNYHEQWLSEGFAQYFAALYIEHHRGHEAFASVMRQLRNGAIEYGDQGPVYLGYRIGHIRNDSRAFRGIVYNKGAVVLHMLRRLVGDDRFFLGLQRFYVSARFAKTGTDDFRRAMELETGLSLDRFFENWIYQAATPHLKLSWRVDPDRSGAAVVRIEQVSPADAIFDMPITLSLQYADRRTSDVTIPMHDRVAEQAVPINGILKSIDLSRDDGTLAIIDK